MRLIYSIRCSCVKLAECLYRSILFASLNWQDATLAYNGKASRGLGFSEEPLFPPVNGVALNANGKGVITVDMFWQNLVS
jgi:hypothetical protein